MRTIQPYRKPWLLSIYIILSAFGFAQVKQEWVAQYNGTWKNIDARSFAVDKNGNVYVTGSATGEGTGLDYSTIMYNAAGVQQWEARYNGPGNKDDVAFSLCKW